MTLSLPFGPGGRVDIPSVMDSTLQPFDPQDQWQINGAELGADRSIHSRPQGPSIPGGFGANVRRI